jgi:hypothetical protein
VDFVWTRGSRAVGIDVKSASRWRPRDGAALQELLRQGVVQRGVGVYLGKAPQRDGALEVLSLSDFLVKLHRGKILG